MKSAYELAMERLEKSAPSTPLTDAQKEQIAEIDSLYRAKIAEREVFLQGEISKATESGDISVLGDLERQLATDIRRLKDEAAARKEKVRGNVT